MGWDTLAPAPTTAATPAAPVRLSMRKMRNGRAKMAVMVEIALLEKVAGKEAGRFTIQLGSGAEAHQLRIVHDSAGLFEPRPAGRSKKYSVFRLPPVERFPDRSIAATVCSHSIEKTPRALVIDMPSWAWLKRGGGDAS